MAELGKNLVVQVDGTKIGVSRSCSFSMSADTVDTSNKDQDWKGKEPGQRSASVSSDGLIDFDDTNGIFAIDDALLNATKVTLIWGKASPSTGEITYTGDFLVTNFELAGDNNAEGTHSAQFESDGAITRTVTP